MTKVIAIIPARGGSKGIPGKNLVLVGGKPLITHTIAHALATPEIRRTLVSTDSTVIAEVARGSGAEVVIRPLEISGDTATSESALRHALDHLKATEGYEPELVAFLQATSPLRQRYDISRAIETLRAEGADSLFSSTPVQGFVWRRTQDGLSSLSYDYNRRPRRQEHVEDLIENGSIYLFKPWILQRHNNRLGGRIAVYKMHSFASFQIDEPDDVPILNSLYSIQLKEDGRNDAAACETRRVRF